MRYKNVLLCLNAVSLQVKLITAVTSWLAQEHNKLVALTKHNIETTWAFIVWFQFCCTDAATVVNIFFTIIHSELNAILLHSYLRSKIGATLMDKVGNGVTWKQHAVIECSDYKRMWRDVVSAHPKGKRAYFMHDISLFLVGLLSNVEWFFGIL